MVEVPTQFDIEFDSSSFGKSIYSSWAKFHNRELFNDVNIVINGKEKIIGHKVNRYTNTSSITFDFAKFVLAANSVKLLKLLKDASTGELQLTLKPEEVEVFKIMILFMYTGSCTVSWKYP